MEAVEAKAPPLSILLFPGLPVPWEQFTEILPLPCHFRGGGRGGSKHWRHWPSLGSSGPVLVNSGLVWSSSG